MAGFREALSLVSCAFHLDRAAFSLADLDLKVGVEHLTFLHLQCWNGLTKCVGAPVISVLCLSLGASWSSLLRKKELIEAM